MAIAVNFYQFSKKSNSTKRASELLAKTFDCNLMEPTSVVAPKISLLYPGNPAKYNYAYIQDFGRYYFVGDWLYTAGRWVASLTCDTLASWKEYIGDADEYIVRSSAEWDGAVMDTLYPTKTNVRTESVSNSAATNTGTSNPFISDFDSGCYVVGIVNGDTSAVGTVSYYVFTNSQFRSFCGKLMGSATWFMDGITEIGEELAKSLFNPFQYIASCMWFPLVFTGDGVTEIQYGWWKMPATAKRLNSPTATVPAIFNLPTHPQAYRGSYLNKSPFSRYTLTWPVFGQFALPGEIVGGKNISCECYVDAISGSGTLMCRVHNGGVLFTSQVSVGVTIQISQMVSNVAGVGGSVVSGIANLFTGNIGGLFQSVGDAVSSAMPQVNSKGSNGSGSAYKFAPTVECEFFPVADEDLEHRGRPLMQKRRISDLPGYLMCADVDIEIPCTHAELQEIKGSMEGGFYYE